MLSYRSLHEKNMTLEEINNKIRERLLDGRGQAVSRGHCVYWSLDDNCCAIGCLLKEHYSREMEGSSIDSRVSISKGKWISLDDDYAPSAKLAEVLNKSDIPATPEVLRALIRWQDRHDTTANWDGKRYIGPLRDPS